MTLFIVLIVCIVVAGLFSGLETGLLAVNRMVNQDKSSKGVLHARAVEFLLSKPERLLGTTLIGYNVANLTAAVLVTHEMNVAGLDSYTWIAILAMTFLFLVFDDFIPKSVFRQYANTLSARLAPVLVFFYWLFMPPYLVLNSIVKVLIFFSGKRKAQREELRTKRDLRFLVNLAGKEAGLPPADQKMIEDILHFRDQLAREVMIPFHRLPVLHANQEVTDAIRVSIESGFRFIPVSRDRTDNMVGYIDTLELLWTSKPTAQDIMKKAEYYPETCRIPDLLLDMNKRKLNVVFLVDEYGAISGMTTPNQIVADVVHYSPEEGSLEGKIQKLGPGIFQIDGDFDLEDVCHELGISLGRSVNSTIGGYVTERLGTIPDVNATYSEAGYTFIVKRRDDRHILQLEAARSGQAEQHAMVSSGSSDGGQHA